MTYNTCFQIPLLLQAYVEPQFIDHVNTFLTSLCAPTTPTCSEESIKASTPGLEAACWPDYKDNPGSVQGLTTVVMGNYPEVKAALCSRNLQWVFYTISTNRRGTFCAVEVLTSVQKKIGVEIDYPMVRDAINGNSTFTPQLEEMLQSGTLCTGCVSRYLYLGRQIKTSVPLPDALPSVQARCGSWFGSKL